MPTYVNNMTFHDGKTLHRRGEVNASPKKEHIQKGMVRAVKINPPSEVKDARRKKRKSENTAKLETNRTSDELVAAVTVSELAEFLGVDDADTLLEGIALAATDAVAKYTNVEL